jgi:hypothetical protein
LVEAAVDTAGKVKVWLEGETDPVYFTTAAEILGFGDIIAQVEFEWIGAKDPKSGQGFNTGKDALNQAFSLLCAKPEIASRKVILLYDTDAAKPASDFGNIHVRTIALNRANTVAKRGIENLLPETAFTDDVYDVVEREREYGGSVTTRSLNKMRLCTKLCSARDPAVFAGFRDTLELIDLLIK